MQRKLDWLSPISEQPDNYGNVYVNMKFDDGTLAYKAGKPSDMAQHYADLLGIQMAGELVEIDLEDTGKKTQKGATKYKLVGYPGWSAPVAQGGKAQANASNGDKDDSIARAVALKAAVAWASSEPLVPFSSLDGVPVQPLTLLGAADKFYDWLINRGEGQQDAEVRASGDEAAKPITERTTDPIPVSTSAVVNGEGHAAVESKGEPVSTGGSKRAGSPEDNPWEGMDV